MAGITLSKVYPLQMCQYPVCARMYVHLYVCMNVHTCMQQTQLQYRLLFLNFNWIQG